MYLPTIWLIGVAFSLLSVALLTIVIPLLERGIQRIKSELGDLEYRREVRLFQNHQDYLHYSLKEKVIRLSLMIAFNLPDHVRNALQDEYIEAKRNSVDKMHILCTGEAPSSEVAERRKRMSFEELQAELVSLLNGNSVNLLLGTIRDKKKEVEYKESIRTRLLLGAAALQVIGLLIVSATDYHNRLIDQMKDGVSINQSTTTEDSI
ncbi:MAG: hypothetical protein PHW10_01840 [Candidatus Peribacteraceae bacterium]|nr:hypothetical protein [Candidatus Peribacteraceae bacterium]